MVGEMEARKIWARSRGKRNGRCKRVTMAEVAAAADVSVPTVSKVLNRPPRCCFRNPSQRSRKVIHTSGYTRNKRGKPGRQKPWLIDLVFSEFGPYATEIIKGAEESRAAEQVPNCSFGTDGCNAKKARWLTISGEGIRWGNLRFRRVSPEHRERLKALHRR